MTPDLSHSAHNDATMLKATVTGPRTAVVERTVRPRAVDNWVVVKVHVAPMCTEYKTFVSGGPAVTSTSTPRSVEVFASACSLASSQRVS